MQPILSALQSCRQSAKNWEKTKIDTLLKALCPKKIPAICCVESIALYIVNVSTRTLPRQAEVSIFIQIVLPDNPFPPFVFAQTREIRIQRKSH